MRFRERLLVVALSCLLLPLAVVRAQSRDKQITIAEAREILDGESPVAIPGYPVALFRTSKAVLVVQTLDSGRDIMFVEDRQGSPRWFQFGGPSRSERPFQSQDGALLRDNMPIGVTTGFTLNAAPSADQQVYPRLWAYMDARDGYRRIGKVSVRWVGSGVRERAPKQLLDQLAPLP